MDLGWNQLANWEEIALIMANLPNMRCLNLGHNPIGKEVGLFRIRRLPYSSE